MEACRGFPLVCLREFLNNTDIVSIVAVILGYNLLHMSTKTCNYMICAQK
jgi:hypothetical protein